MQYNILKWYWILKSKIALQILIQISFPNERYHDFSHILYARLIPVQTLENIVHLNILQDRTTSCHINNRNKYLFFLCTKRRQLKETIRLLNFAKDHSNAFLSYLPERYMLLCWHYQRTILKRQSKARFLCLHFYAHCELYQMAKQDAGYVTIKIDIQWNRWKVTKSHLNSLYSK